MKIWLVDLESVETRYTSEWKIHVPKILANTGLFSDPIDVEVLVEELASCYSLKQKKFTVIMIL